MQCLTDEWASRPILSPTRGMTFRPPWRPSLSIALSCWWCAGRGSKVLDICNMCRSGIASGFWFGTFCFRSQESLSRRNCCTVFSIKRPGGLFGCLWNPLGAQTGCREVPKACARGGNQHCCTPRLDWNFCVGGVHVETLERWMPAPHAGPGSMEVSHLTHVGVARRFTRRRFTTVGLFGGIPYGRSRALFAAFWVARRMWELLWCQAGLSVVLLM